MGVAWVFECSQSARAVELIFEQAGAVLQGPPQSFRVESTWYKPESHISSSINGFYLLHHSNFPESAFIITANKASDTGTNQQPANRLPPLPPRATADKGFELQLAKFQSAGLTEDSLKTMVVGNEYHLKDFRLRVGIVTLGTSVKGVIVELEFAPSYIVVQCQALLHELVEFFFPGQSLKTPTVFQRQGSQPDNYLAIDTVNQYLDIFLTIRKRT